MAIILEVMSKGVDKGKEDSGMGREIILKK